MKMNAEELIVTLVDAPPRALTPEQADCLRQYIRQNPASAALPAALLIRHGRDLLTSDELASLKEQFAAKATDRAALFRIASPTGGDFDDFFRASAPAPAEHVSTEQAIDTFLETFGHQSPEEDALLERLIFNPVPDYSEVLAAQAEPGAAPVADQTEAVIDAFLGAAQSAPRAPEGSPADEPEGNEPVVADPRPTPAPPEKPASETAEAGAPESLLSESLAKIFIKQGRYERAYEIISNLNLNFPQKSCYFADQLRFLQKLILIKQSQTQQSNTAPSAQTNAE